LRKTEPHLALDVPHLAQTIAPKLPKGAVQAVSQQGEQIETTLAGGRAAHLDIVRDGGSQLKR